MKCFLYVNSVSGLCLRLRDTTLNINFPFDMCRWLVEGEDVEVVHISIDPRVITSLLIQNIY